MFRIIRDRRYSIGYRARLLRQETAARAAGWAPVRRALDTAWTATHRPAR